MTRRAPGRRFRTLAAAAGSLRGEPAGPLFRDRLEAGRVLAACLEDHAADEPAVVLGLPRGGVPVAYPVACALGKPLDVFVVRKLGVPGHEELAMGAIASGDVQVINRSVVDHLGLTADDVAEVARTQAHVLAEREGAYRGGRPAVPLQGANVIVVDDGLATGATMRAAVTALRRQDPEAIVVAVPVAAADTREAIRAIADDVVCAYVPEDFLAVGLWYEDFSQTTDDEVRALLARARSRA